MSKPKTMSDLGRIGGRATAARRGPGFYAEIGRKGGAKTKATKGADYFEKIGAKGGAKVAELIAAGKAGRVVADKATKASQLTPAEAGRKGGLSTKKKHGLAHYSKIGLVGGATVRALVAKSKGV